MVRFVEKIEGGLKRHSEASNGKNPPYLGGIDGTPQAVDFLAWPWLERLGAISIRHPSRLHMG